MIMINDHGNDQPRTQGLDPRSRLGKTLAGAGHVNPQILGENENVT